MHLRISLSLSLSLPLCPSYSTGRGHLTSESARLQLSGGALPLYSPKAMQPCVGASLSLSRLSLSRLSLSPLSLSLSLSLLSTTHLYIYIYFWRYVDFWRYPGTSMDINMYGINIRKYF